MKQKEVFTDPSLGFESEKMIKMLFASKTVGKVEGFIYSLDDFLKTYKNTYTINDLRTAKFYVVYDGYCNYCSQEHEIIVSKRKQLYAHLNSDAAICNRCSIFQSTLERILGSKFD